MAKFKNIKKNPDGSFVLPASTVSRPGGLKPPIPSVKPKKEKAPEPVKPVIPLATYNPEPPHKSLETEAKKLKIVERTKSASKTILVSRPTPTPAKKLEVKPRKIGLFVLIMFFTVVLQIVLLVSLLYLSPSLIH